MQADTIVSSLEVPWALAFAPDGRLFVTERPGRVRIVTSPPRHPRSRSRSTTSSARARRACSASRWRRTSRPRASCISTTRRWRATAPSIASSATARSAGASANGPCSSTTSRRRRSTTAAGFASDRTVCSTPPPATPRQFACAGCRLAVRQVPADRSRRGVRARQPVRLADLQLGPPQSAGIRLAPGDRRDLGHRARQRGQRRDQRGPRRRQLRVADDRRGADVTEHGGAGHVVQPRRSHRPVPRSTRARAFRSSSAISSRGRCAGRTCCAWSWMPRAGG